MATDDSPHNQLVRKAVLQRPDAVADVTIRLWERLASELIAIIGDDGFESLYARSIHLTSATFPWMTPAHAAPGTNSQFAGLKKDLNGRDVAQAGEASITLLITFINILAVLIGERLMASILHAAWDHDALDTAVEEFLK